MFWFFLLCIGIHRSRTHRGSSIVIPGEAILLAKKMEEGYTNTEKQEAPQQQHKYQQQQEMLTSDDQRELDTGKISIG